MGPQHWRSQHVVKIGEARRLALSLPEAHEKGHHGIPSFRVANKIFATVPDNEHLHVMVGPDEADMAVGAPVPALHRPGRGPLLAWRQAYAGMVGRADEPRDRRHRSA